MIGIVKFFDPKKGFGFISAQGEDYFVHFSAIGGSGFKTLHEGDKVDFKVVKGERGMQAYDVLTIRDN